MAETVTPLVPLPHRLALVRCPECGDEWPDLEAALSHDGGPCRNGCGRLTDPVYDWSDTARAWVRGAAETPRKQRSESGPVDE